MRFAPTSGAPHPSNRNTGACWGPRLRAGLRQSGCALFSDRCGTTKDRALLLVSPGESFSANCKARIFWAFSARLKSRPVTCCISQSIFHSLSKKRALQGDSNCQRANSIAAWAGVRPLIFKGLGRVPSLHHPTNQHPVCHGRGYARGFCQAVSDDHPSNPKSGLPGTPTDAC
jgi:hypothetical protein